MFWNHVSFCFKLHSDVVYVHSYVGGPQMFSHCFVLMNSHIRNPCSPFPLLEFLRFVYIKFLRVSVRYFAQIYRDGELPLIHTVVLVRFISCFCWYIIFILYVTEKSFNILHYRCCRIVFLYIFLIRFLWVSPSFSNTLFKAFVAFVCLYFVVIFVIIVATSLYLFVPICSLQDVFRQRVSMLNREAAEIACDGVILDMAYSPLRLMGCALVSIV